MFGIPGPCTPNSSLGLRTPTDFYKGWDATSSPGNLNVFRYVFTINLPINKEYNLIHTYLKVVMVVHVGNPRLHTFGYSHWCSH